MDRNELVGIYLAAGFSTRMGEDKLALPFGKLPLGAVALAQALLSRLDRIFVVINGQGVPAWLDDSIPHCPESWKCRIVVCPDAAEGMSRSIHAGIHEAAALKARAAMILLADQPLVTTEMLNKLIDRFLGGLESDKELRYAASSSGNVLSPPMLFSKEAFPDLISLNGDSGAKQILHRMKGMTVECSDAAILSDIDSRSQYDALVSFASASTYAASRAGSAYSE